MQENRPPLHEKAVFWLGLFLLALPVMLFSSHEHIRAARLVALAAFVFASSPVLGRGRFVFDIRGKLLVAGFLVAHLSSLYGGWGGNPWEAVRLAIEGICGVLGLTVFTAVLLEPRWRTFEKRFGVAALGVLLACSLCTYFLPIEKLIPMGEVLTYFDPTRLVLIWPTRLLMGWLGQLGWEHANFAGALFAIGTAMILEFIARNPGTRCGKLWLLAGLSGTALFLSGSRSGLLMLAVALPLLLFGRNRVFAVKLAGVLALSFFAGCLCLKTKQELIRRAAPSVAAAPDYHLRGLAKRGSAGRLSAYETFWDEEKKSMTFGRGLAATGKPARQLPHEHSSYLATFRGGGFVALAGHLLVLGASLRAGLILFRQDLRWPLMFLASVLTGILFDHSSVFVLSARYDFMVHWMAVLIPLLLVAKRKAAA